MQQLAKDRNFYRVAIGGLVGSILEWFDFTVYIYLAPIMARLFFPHESPYLSLILAYSVFAVGYLARPVGGFFFGHYGDRIGRRRTVAMSMLLMSISTVLIGFLPTYAQVGLWAPLLLVLLRIVQGFAAVGEVLGAVTFSFESSPTRYRGTVATSIWIGSGIGVVLASALVALITMLLSKDQVHAWGWRLPFFFGIVTAIMGFYVRRSTQESVYFSAMVRRGELMRFPSLAVLRQYKKHLAKIIFIFIPPAINYYIFFIFLPTYSPKFLGHDLPEALWITSITMTFLFFITPLVAYASDRMGRKPFMLAALVGNVLLPVFLFQLVATGTVLNFFIAQAVFAVTHCLYTGAVLSAALESVPTRVRFSAMAIGVNFSYSVFGGTAPLIVTYLIHRNQTLIAPAFYTMLVALIALLVVLNMRESYKDVVL